jgi:ABC-2 type transport system ATP-binding protein
LTGTFEFDKIPVVIKVNNVSKSFDVPQKSVGLKAALTGLFHRPKIRKTALSEVSLSVCEGEILGLLGSNGAGKTTLVKAMAGILHPSSGSIEIYGECPWERSVRFRKSIALVMGQKAQLWWDLPALDCFELLREIYEVPRAKFQTNLDELVELLDVAALLKTQVRRLSLGERMKMELIAALLHGPRVVFLDEPTIGLDMSSQRKVRHFLLEYRRRHKPIMILTSHYMEDIESLCERIVILNQGQVVFDGPISEVRSQHKVVAVQWVQSRERSSIQAKAGIEILSHDDMETRFLVPRDEVTRFASQILSEGELRDLGIEEPDLGRVIEPLMQRPHV